MDRLLTSAFTTPIASSSVCNSIAGREIRPRQRHARSIQARYWMLTIPETEYSVDQGLPTSAAYFAGQQEIGATTGYAHWQAVIYFRDKVSLGTLRALFPRAHAEPTRSTAARDYVWKDDTAVPGTRFEFGTMPMNRNRRTDWDAVLVNAQAGNWDSIPSDVYIRCFSNLNKIHVQSLKPVAQEKTIYVFWGRTGTGKSRRAWDEATFDAFPKDPCTKWWDGYAGQRNVVIDEFRGQIGISHLLR